VDARVIGAGVPIAARIPDDPVAVLVPIVPGIFIGSFCHLVHRIIQPLDGDYLVFLDQSISPGSRNLRFSLADDQFRFGIGIDFNPVNPLFQGTDSDIGSVDFNRRLIALHDHIIDQAFRHLDLNPGSTQLGDSYIGVPG
jgi:hypothetical protein